MLELWSRTTGLIDMSLHGSTIERSIQYARTRCARDLASFQDISPYPRRVVRVKDETRLAMICAVRSSCALEQRIPEQRTVRETVEEGHVGSAAQKRWFVVLRGTSRASCCRA